MKKKFRGGLGLLLVVLFIIFLSMFSTCYAVDYTDFDIPIEWFEALLDYIELNKSYGQVPTSLKPHYNAEYIKSIYDNEIKQNLRDYALSLGCDDRNLICYINVNNDKYSAGNFHFCFMLNNNSVGDNASNQAFKYSSSNYISNVASGLNYYIIKLTNSVSSPRYEVLVQSGSRASYWRYDSANYDDSTSTYNNGPFFGMNKAPLNIIDMQYNNNTSHFYFINGYYPINEDEIIIPEPEDTTTGTITNSSGDTTGKVDLSGITSGISNINDNLNDIERKIPTSGDIQQATVSGVIQANNDFWGTSGDLTGDYQEDYITNELGDIQSDLEDTFSSNEIFDSLNDYENRLFDLFTGEEDFVLSWDTITLYDTTLVEEGEFNITEFVESNQTLTHVKNLINIIVSFGCFIALISQIYNLILSSLGIDNPYLYENEDISEVINADTGEVRTRVYRNRRLYKR